jgi:hypothetical protein
MKCTPRITSAGSRSPYVWLLVTVNALAFPREANSLTLHFLSSNHHHRRSSYVFRLASLWGQPLGTTAIRKWQSARSLVNYTCGAIPWATGTSRCNCNLLCTEMHQSCLPPYLAVLAYLL